MITVGVRELREDLSKWLQRVRDEGETIEITLRGETVARLVPTRRKSSSPEEIARQFADLDELAQEISKHWKSDMNAVEAVREQRREL